MRLPAGSGPITRSLASPSYSHLHTRKPYVDTPGASALGLRGGRRPPTSVAEVEHPRLAHGRCSKTATFGCQERRSWPVKRDRRDPGRVSCLRGQARRRPIRHRPRSPGPPRLRHGDRHRPTRESGRPRRGHSNWRGRQAHRWCPRRADHRTWSLTKLRFWSGTPRWSLTRRGSGYRRERGAPPV
mgnify:CR=1 FL=1